MSLLSRNGAIHIASPPIKGGIIREALVVSNFLLDAMAVDSVEFWGRYSDVVGQLTADHGDRVKAEVGLLVAEARAYYANRFAELPEEERVTIRNAIEESRPPLDEAEVEEECPACSRQGVLSGYAHIDWQADFDGDGEGGHLQGMVGTLIFYPGQFFCAFCRLHLVDAESLRVVGLAEPVELLQADNSEYLETYDESYADSDS